MSDKGSGNIISIGFIDLLTGFLCATAALMIIIKYGAEQAGELAGGPKDYILYSSSLEFLNPSDQQKWNLDDLRLQLIIKTPENRWLESAIDEEGMELGEQGFLDFRDQQFYGLGPSKKQGEDKRYYHVYGVSEIRRGDVWEVGLRYYSHRVIEEELKDQDDELLEELLSREFLVTHTLKHVDQVEDGDDQSFIQKVDTMTFGQDSYLRAEVFGGD